LDSSTWISYPNTLKSRNTTWSMQKVQFSRLATNFSFLSTSKTCYIYSAYSSNVLL
jgi:hypothetical protein